MDATKNSPAFLVHRRRAPSARSSADPTLVCGLTPRRGPLAKAGTELSVGEMSNLAKSLGIRFGPTGVQAGLDSLRRSWAGSQFKGSPDTDELYRNPLAPTHPKQAVSSVRAEELAPGGRREQLGQRCAVSAMQHQPA